MVGVTGIEPVTPTMSTSFPHLQPLQLRQLSTTYHAVSGNESRFVLVFRFSRAREHYVN